MSADKAQSCYSIPGKVFLLGEYSVLLGSPAILAATRPRFSARFDGAQHFSHLPHTASREFHPQSPAGRLERSLSSGIPHFEFHDAYQENGGFGASTAQFALSYALMGGARSSWQEIYKRYRELMAAENELPPSGADLVAQWLGGVVYFDPEKMECQQLSQIFPWNRLMIFSAAHQAGRKVATHEHLKVLERSGIFKPGHKLVEELSAITRAAYAEIVQDKPGGPDQTEKFGELLSAYGEGLAQAGLELAATSREKARLSAVSGVLGVKGAGAMQADGIVVWTSKDCARALVLEKARALDLKYLGEFSSTPGMMEECAS